MSENDVPVKRWSLLAYTVADDRSGGGSLDQPVKEELKALCEAADFRQVSIAAQVDFRHTRGVFRGTLTKAPPKSRGFEDVRAENHPLWRKILSQVDQEALKIQMEREDLNAAGGNVLQEFIRYGHQECPADRYVVFFYGHAYGPMGLFYDRETRNRPPNTLRLNDLAGSIEAAGGRAAVVVFRDCFMSTLETACQLRGVADFMIASQSEMPIAGIWPWKGFIANLTPDSTSADVAASLVKQLADFLDEPANRGPFPDVPVSLIDVTAIDAVRAPLIDLVNALEEARQDPHRVPGCAQALEGARMGYSSKDHVRPGDPALLDVPILCERLQALADPVAAPARALGEVVRTRLVTWHHSQQGRYQGVSLYYKPVTPEDLERSNIQAGDETDAANDADAYKRLALNTATGWDRIALNPLVPASSTSTWTPDVMEAREG